MADDVKKYAPAAVAKVVAVVDALQALEGWGVRAPDFSFTTSGGDFVARVVGAPHEKIEGVYKYALSFEGANARPATEVGSITCKVTPVVESDGEAINSLVARFLRAA